MIRPGTSTLSVLACAAVLAVTASISRGAGAGEYVVVDAVNRIADRCAARFGEGFVDSGNGICAHISDHTRFYVAPSTAGMNAWSSGATSSAAVMRTDGSVLMPGAPAQHLRVRGNLDSYSPFR